MTMTYTTLIALSCGCNREHRTNRNEKRAPLFPGVPFEKYVQPARVYYLASAALANRLFHLFFCLVYGFVCFLFGCICGGVDCFVGRVLYVFFSAPGAGFMTTSATCSSRLFYFASAPGARFGTSATTRVYIWYRNTSCTDQPGDTEPGKQFVEFFFFHNILPEGN